LGPGPGFPKEYTIMEDGRVVARFVVIAPNNRIIKELKPDTASGRSAGLGNLSATGDWRKTGSVETGPSSSRRIGPPRDD
jgi:hypothetical protein